jgi:hypothetical protein
MIDKAIAGLEFLYAAIQASVAIAKAVSNMLDAIPVFGAIVDGLVQLAIDMQLSTAYGATIGALSNPDVYDDLYCFVFCTLLDLGADGLQTLDAQTLKSSVAQYCLLHLPGQALEWQALGGFILAYSEQRIMQELIIHYDERSDDCDIACSDCQRPAVMDWCMRYQAPNNERLGNWGLVSGGHGVYIAGDGAWYTHSPTYGVPKTLNISRGIAIGGTRKFVRCKVYFGISGATGLTIWLTNPVTGERISDIKDLNAATSPITLEAGVGEYNASNIAINIGSIPNPVPPNNNNFFAYVTRIDIYGVGPSYNDGQGVCAPNG